MIQVVIIDAQDSERSQSESVLLTQSDFKIVGIGKDGYDALRLVENCKPDILLLDINLSYIDGVKAASILKRRFPRMAIIILTWLDNDTYALNALCNGVSGYLLKSTDMKKLVEAIRDVYEGGCHISPHVAAKIFPRVSSQIAQQASPSVQDLFSPVNLTKKELQITCLVGKGLSNQEIAEKMALKIGTIRNHITVILQKTSLRNRTQLAVFAVQNGFTKESPVTQETCPDVYRISTSSNSKTRKLLPGIAPFPAPRSP
ncbi:MAG: response regulator transcription factor [Treponema sp.]|jgi:DNA-binding NarL/FixJ family response regulator|nr:response regulator transcription factor [Treponema sp.]